MAVQYGRAVAVQGVSLQVPTGSVVCLLGANGAGKSSVLAAIAGLVPPASGKICWQGKEITGWTPPRVLREAGIALVPERRELFASMSVAENLDLGAYTRRDPGGVRQDLDRVLTLFPVLGQFRNRPAQMLSGGQQQMLAIGRALMARPRLLCLDEPSLGLAPALALAVYRTLAEISRDGVTLLLVEEKGHLALSVASYGYVLRTGRVVAAGPVDRLRSSEELRLSYLGPGLTAPQAARGVTS